MDISVVSDAGEDGPSCVTRSGSRPSSVCRTQTLTTTNVRVRLILGKVTMEGHQALFTAPSHKEVMPKYLHWMDCHVFLVSYSNRLEYQLG